MLADAEVIMQKLIAPALAYFAVVFGAGFAMGTVRVLFIEPFVGRTAAVAAEAPFLLIISVAAAAWIVRKLHVEAEAPPRLVMGAMAFVFLIVAETSLGLLFGRDLQSQLADLSTAAGLIGFASQAAFALTPFALLLFPRQSPG
jgi:hypothetical protein